LIVGGIIFVLFIMAFEESRLTRLLNSIGNKMKKKGVKNV